MSEPLAEGAPQGEPPRDDHRQRPADAPTAPRRRAAQVAPPARLAWRPQPQPTPSERRCLDAAGRRRDGADDDRPELPERPIEGRPSVEAAERALVRKPQIGDTRPAPGAPTRRRRRRPDSRRGRLRRPAPSAVAAAVGPRSAAVRRRRPRTSTPVRPVLTDDEPIELDDDVLETRRGTRAQGPARRSLPHVRARAAQRGRRSRQRPGRADRGARGAGADRALRVAPGRRRQPDPRQHLPRQGAERPARHGGGVRRHRHAEERGAVPRRRAVRPRGRRGANAQPRIEQLLRAKQTILCQVTKNPIGAKGARLTQEVSLPGRFVVLIPNSSTYGISKRLPDDERKRLRYDPRQGEAEGARRDRAHRGREGDVRGDRARRRCACCGSGSRSTRWRSGHRRRRCCTASPTWRCG